VTPLTPDVTFPSASTLSGLAGTLAGTRATDPLEENGSSTLAAISDPLVPFVG
jgi:hypothetical protein